MKKVKMGLGRIGVKFSEERRENILTVLEYTDDLVPSGESEENLSVMIRCFVEVWRKDMI